MTTRFPRRAHPGPTPHPDRRSRRTATVAAGIAMVIVSVSACSSSDPVEAGDSGSPAGVWSFTDDRDITHTLPEVPDVIAAQSVPAGGLWEYGIEIDGVFGPLRRPDGSPDPAIGLADPADFTSLGEIDSEINLEALAALQPDIIVTSMWDDGTYWGIDDEEADQLVSWASVHAYGYGNLAAIIDRLAEAVATASPDLV